jgi:hypothetical protein
MSGSLKLSRVEDPLDEFSFFAFSWLISTNKSASELAGRNPNGFSHRQHALLFAVERSQDRRLDWSQIFAQPLIGHHSFNLRQMATRSAKIEDGALIEVVANSASRRILHTPLRLVDGVVPTVLVDPPSTLYFILPFLSQNSELSFFQNCP